MRMNLFDICRVLESGRVGMDAKIARARPSGAAIDSRAVKKGDLFFCLPGENADGHDFAEAAADGGALAVVGVRDPFGGGHPPVPVILVADAVRALGKLAAAHRQSTDATVIGVTGTSGKTSVKEALCGVLAEHGETAKNPGNLNNRIGLPLSVCNASENAAYWVMEAGISRPGDMDELGEILRPDAALILNVGAGHVLELGEKGVAHHKARLLAHLAKRAGGPGAFAAVSADYPDLVREAASYGEKIIWFSAKDATRSCYAEYLGPAPSGGGRFSLVLDGAASTLTAPFQGGYGAENVAAVGALAHALGLDHAAIREGFGKAEAPKQRFAVRRAGSFLVIDDSYNANPLSMNRMLHAAAGMAGAEGGKLALVLGEMLELGPESPRYHRELGEYAASLAPEAVYWKGGQEDAVAGGLREGAYRGAFVPVKDAAEFTAAFASSGMGDAVVLFKGSRGNKLEELVAAFMARALAAGADKGREDAV